MSAAPETTVPAAGTETQALIQEARRRQRRRYLLTGAAAAAVLASAAGVVLSQLGPGGRPPYQALLSAPRWGGAARYASAPAYYAYIVRGNFYDYVSHGTEYSASGDRYVKIRATATGKLLATVSPPKPYNEFRAITADASGRTFVLAADRFWQRNAGPSPRLAQRDLRTPLKFLLVHITPAGHVEKMVLPLPDTVTPLQGGTIALSPDGTRLAVAFRTRNRTATIQVITLTTGQTRRWVSPHNPWTPMLNGVGAWTADGRTLAFGLRLIPPPGRHAPSPAPAAVPVRLLDTSAPGTALAASTLVMLRSPVGEPINAEPFLIPDGSKLVAPAASERFGQPDRPWRGELAVYSARTGALLHTAAPWVWRWTNRPGRGGFPEQSVVWSSRSGGQLIVLQPRADLNVLGDLASTTFRQRAGTLPPPGPAYQELQDALRAGSQLAW